MPIKPDNTGGAGTGSFAKANTTPQIPPVTSDKTISFISLLYPNHLYRLRQKNLYFVHANQN